MYSQVVTKELYRKVFLDGMQEDKLKYISVDNKGDKFSLNQCPNND